jgi:hypothetical protein
MFSRDAGDITSVDWSGLKPFENFDHALFSSWRGVIGLGGASGRHDE